MKPVFRFLAALIALACLAAGVVFHMGGRQVEYVASVEIEGVTPQQVMDHLSKPELVKLWDDDLIEMTIDPKATRQPGATAKSKVEGSEGQKDLDVEIQLLASTDRSLTVLNKTKTYETISTWSVNEKSNDRVQLRQLTIAKYQGLKRFLIPFDKEGYQAEVDQLQKDLDQLKLLLESKNQSASGRKSLLQQQAKKNQLLERESRTRITRIPFRNEGLEKLLNGTRSELAEN